MRLSFANGAHADFVLDAGVASLGQAEGNTVTLPGKDVAARHARISVDSRGIVLDVLDPHARTHLNARPIREKALLRCGDVLCLGTVTIHVKMDRDEQIETRVPVSREGLATPASPSRVMLRGVSGSHFGKVLAVNPRLTVGSAADCGLVISEANIAPRHAVIENVGDAIYVRTLGASNGHSVNGVRVTHAVVHPGDQLAFERNHFLVEAPGLPLRGEARDDVVEGRSDGIAPVSSVPVDTASPVTSIWWLIGVAAVIGLLLVLLIHRGI
ncbi:MAG: FHA domain-containing protein [Dokdonella sp.]|uniref:FHA domain-containing protein n=1 Tax=Dokdonella sp. TaxID=2291710 RepID=UPI003266ED07